MRVSILLLCFVMSFGFCFGQKKVEQKKEVIIIKKEKVEGEEDEMMKKIEEMSDVDELIKKLSLDDSDSVNVEVDVTEENGVVIKKIIVRSMKDGVESVNEIIEKTGKATSGQKIEEEKVKIYIAEIEEEEDASMKEKKMLNGEKEMVIIKKQIEGNEDATIDVKVDVEEMEGGKQKVIVKTIKDGKEHIEEIIVDTEEKGRKKKRMMFIGEEGMKEMDLGDDMEVIVKEISGGEHDSIQVKVEFTEDDGNTFIWKTDDENVLPDPTVRMGVMIAEATIIDGLVENSPAEKAGLMKGDKILKLDNQVIYSVRGLLEHLTSYKMGDKAKVTIERDGKEMKKTIQF